MAPLLLLATLSGCSSKDSSSSIDSPTLVSVDPLTFLGNVPCAEAPGAMRRFVATIEDVTGDLGEGGARFDDFTLPSSPPVSCTQPVGFSFVVIGHRYVADVQGYDRTDIEPLVVGSPVMVSRATGDVVPARWTTSCGRQAEGTDTSVIAQRYLTIPVRGCVPLTDHLDGGTPTGLVVDLTLALGTLSCGAETGQVQRYEVTRVTTGEMLSGACGESVQFVDLQAGATELFELGAYEADASEARWQTTCYAVVQAGALLSVACDPLAEPA